jgi:hypothetical protein
MVPHGTREIFRPPFATQDISLGSRLTRNDIGGLFRRDDDLHCGVRPENLAVASMMLRIPVPDTPLDLAEKVEATLLRPGARDRRSGLRSHARPRYGSAPETPRRPRWPMEYDRLYPSSEYPFVPYLPCRDTSQFCIWGWPLLSTIVEGG